MSNDSSITGTVIRGDGRGRDLGFPTANLELDSNAAKPPDGDYAAFAQLDGDATQYQATVHNGPRPTFPGARPSLEVHLLDFPDRDLYGQRLTIWDLHYLRPIKKFATIDELKQALANDSQHARTILKKPS